MWARAVVAGVLCATAGSAAAQQAGKQVEPAGAEQRLAVLKAAGREASLTVYPAGLIGRPVRPVGDVIAVMLERAGMTKLEVDAPEFRAPDKADLGEAVKAFGEFVRANPPRTEYALFADFRGTREKGFEEVRIVIANQTGDVVWQDRQTADDADFKRISPKEPMQCCLLVAERLRSVLTLDDPTSDSAPEGRMARRLSERSGLPEKAEQDAMQARQQAFKKAAATARLLVYPALAGDEVSKDSAANLAKLFNDAGLTKASATDAGPQLQIKGDMNEQKTLWEMARGVRAFVQAQRPEAEYVLFAHYLMGEDATGKDVVGGVHFVVCDREGQWVIVDFQNDHHDDFSAINPASRPACDRLIARRLTGYCR
jgi:hypothetical protein